MKLVYKPLGLIFSVLGGIVAGGLFKRIWMLATHEAAKPKATDEDKGWREVVAAASLEGAVFGATKALIDRGGATGFAKITGVWPGATQHERSN